MPKPKILVVEDSKSIALFYKKILEIDYDVEMVYDGKEGYDKAKEIKPDLIVLDVMLPSMDGFTICRLLKFDEEFKNIPIIMQTSRSEEEDKQSGKETGADVFLNKPVDEKTLKNAVYEMLKKKGSVV